VILGITPDKPETGYGYIRRQGDVGQHGEYVVAQFAEKPNLEMAEKYLESGDYLWNSGMFVLKASTWLKALKHFRSDIVEATQQSWTGKATDAQFVRPNSGDFALIASDSIDYTVAEKCPNSPFAIKMVPLAAGWNDLGGVGRSLASGSAR